MSDLTYEQKLRVEHYKDPEVIKRAFPDERDVITRQGIAPLDVMTPEQLAAYAEWQAAVREMKRLERLFAEAKEHAQRCTAKMAELASKEQ